jgi:hypothetical protein
MALEIREWVGPTTRHPVEVHLEGDQRGVGVPEQHVERQHPLDRLELEVVVVVGHAETAGSGRLPGAVQRPGHATVIVQRAPILRVQ